MINMANNIPVIHDGCHIVDYKNYFEWWFFDFDLENDNNLQIEWHAPIWNLRENFCMLILRSYNPKAELIHTKKSHESPIIKTFRYPCSSVRQDSTCCKIEFPAGIFFEKQGNYYIDIKEKDLSIKIDLKRLLPPFIAEDEVLYSIQENKEFFAWNIPLPRALATGQIKLNGEYIVVEGTAYHDHNWGNLNFGKYLNGWVWCRVQFDNYTLIFGDIITKNNQKIRKLLFVDINGKKINFSDLEVDYTFSSKRTNGRMHSPESIIIKFQNGNNYRICLKIKTNVPIQEAPLGSFDNHFFNACLSKLYYLMRLNYLPNIIKKWFGRLLYLQSIIIAELYIDEKLIDNQNGRLEVISFAK